MTRISFEEMNSVIRAAFIKAGMPEEKAGICARIHTESSRDGVYSHGLNRVERFVDYIGKGWVDIEGAPSLVQKNGAFEIYDGNLGPGILNAIYCMDRAMELADDTGLAMISIKNTTHWMRGGTYGWRAVEKGFIAICWTNTESCMPPWGARTIAIGNNPFVMAVPREKNPMVFDMAMSQYSYGKLQVLRLKNEHLPFPGGYDEEGNLTILPGPIEETMRILPTGYWKGSGFAILLDVMAALLSGGLSTPGIDRSEKGSCGRCCQVFIAIDPLKINSRDFIEQTISDTINQVKNAEPAISGGEIYYPGELSLKRRHENMKLGIPVDDGVWERVKELSRQ